MSSESARRLLLGDGTTPLKLEYFPIQGVAEKVRVALAVAGVPFKDVHIAWSEWQAKKTTTKYGQIPELTLPDGAVITDSMAMLRLAGEADVDGKLYPADIAARVKVESVLGLVGDLNRAWQPSLYMGMRPEKYGYPPKDEWAEGAAVIEKLRTKFVTDDLPRYMGYFTDLIKEGDGGFLTGGDLTIADIAAYQDINYFRRGVADHVPKECLEPYPEVLEWLGRVEGHAKVAAYNASKAK